MTLYMKAPTLHLKARAFFIMCKPRVNAMIVFTAIIGMLLSGEGIPPFALMFWASAGIALVAFSAAAVNCVIEQAIDARMKRTAHRPLPQGEVGSIETLILAGILAVIGLGVLYWWVNPLTMGLTLITFFGYAIVYTALLKPATPMNIVIGGASGAMPPVLGWSAMTHSITAGALALFLIIFLWTPPHFWALACYRREDYARAGLPMLSVTHGIAFTTWHIVLYTVLLCAASFLPFVMGMSGLIFLFGAIVLDAIFMGYALALHHEYSDDLARRTFKVSVLYLFGLFALMFVDRLAR